MDGVRLTLRVLSVLLPAALLASGVLIVVEVVRASLGQSPWVLPYPGLAETLPEQTWQSMLTRPLAAGLCLLGLLLLPALRRARRPTCRSRR